LPNRVFAKTAEAGRPWFTHFQLKVAEALRLLTEAVRPAPADQPAG